MSSSKFFTKLHKRSERNLWSLKSLWELIYSKITREYAYNSFRARHAVFILFSWQFTCFAYNNFIGWKFQAHNNSLSKNLFKKTLFNFKSLHSQQEKMYCFCLQHGGNDVTWKCSTMASEAKRKPNFSENEILCLIESFDFHKDILLSKFNKLDSLYWRYCCISLCVRFSGRVEFFSPKPTAWVELYKAVI